MTATIGERRGRRMSLPRPASGPPGWSAASPRVRISSERGVRGGAERSERPTGKSAQIGWTGLKLALAAALVAALGVFHVWSRTRVVEAGYQLSALQAEHARLVAAQDQVKLELSMLTSFRALDQAARGKLARLGLAPPDRGAVWAAGPDRAIADPSQAGGGNGDGHPPRPAGPFLASAGASGGPGEAQSEANAPPARSPGARGP